jgi:hypothetical protein
MDGPTARGPLVADRRAFEFFAHAKWAHAEVTTLPIMKLDGWICAVGMPTPEMLYRMAPNNENRRIRSDR